MTVPCFLLVEQIADGGLGELFATHDAINIRSIERFELDQGLGDGFYAITVGGENFLSFVVKPIDEFLDFLVDEL